VFQASLLTFGPPAVAADAPVRRIALDDRSWIDVVGGFVIGADDVMAELAAGVDWRQGRRRMYDREVDDPRLSRWWTDPAAVPHPVLTHARRLLSDRYGVQLGGVGLNYYRDGADSVAFHRDRILRERDQDTLVAIVTLGSRRPFRIRPHGGGRSVDLAPASGDLLVMGGRCQTHWEHGVPKVAHAGPRISASWRWSPGRTHPFE